MVVETKRYARNDLLGKRNYVVGRVREEERMTYNFYTDLVGLGDYELRNFL